MITFHKNNKAAFHVDNLETIKNKFQELGIEYKVMIHKGAECGDVIFNNHMSKFEQKFLESLKY